MGSLIAPKSLSPAEIEIVEKVISSYRPFLLFIAHRVRGDHKRGLEHPSDVVQRALLRAFVKAKGGESPRVDGAEFKKWIRRCLFKSTKKSRPKRFVPIDASIIDPGSSVGTKASRQDEVLRLSKCLTKMDPADRQLLLWRYQEGLTCEEIGRRRGHSAAFASRATRSALIRLKHAFANE